MWTMKKVLKGKLINALLLVAILILSACQPKAEKRQRELTKFICPMHPQIVRNEPGVCPICKMDLVEVHSIKNATPNDSLNKLIEPVNEVVLSDIETVKPQDGSRFATIAAKGIVNYNTNNLNSISSRVSGRIERLYVKYNYQPVAKGQKLMEIYSADLANAQQELLFLKRNGEASLLENAKKKLRLLGATESQINTVLQSGKVDYSFTVYSPYSGYIAEPPSNAGRTALGIMPEGGTSDNGSMGAMNEEAGTSSPVATPKVAENTPLLLREGQYVNAGQKLFSLFNPAMVWIEFYVAPTQLKEFKKGAMIKVSPIGNRQQAARLPISFISPYYKEGTSFALVRAVAPNTNKRWIVGQLVTIEKESERQTGRWLPREAVWQTGNKSVVFVKQDRVFKPKLISVLDKSGDWVNVGGDLSGDMEVAANAWFLVDSEGFVRE